MYTYKRMPFGISTAPGWFQYVMSTLLSEFNLCICAVYLDDVIVFSNTWYQCWLNTMIILRILTSAGFNISSKKCKFCVQSVVMLGHTFSARTF